MYRVRLPDEGIPTCDNVAIKAQIQLITQCYSRCAQGITPLLAALTASSPGVSVVNIDNGFGAGMLAARILKTAARLRAQALAAAVPPQAAAAAPASWAPLA